MAKGSQVNALITQTYDVTVVASLGELKKQIPYFLSAQDVKPRTLEAYGKNITYFFSWAVDHGAVESREDIIEYKNYLLDRKLQNTTINAYLTTVRRFYSWLYDKDIIDKDYAKSVKSVKVDTEHKKDPLTDEQWSRLMDGINLSKELDRRDYIILLLGANYGLRSIEIVRLNREDIIDVQGIFALNLWRKGYDEGSKKPRPVSEAFAELLLDFIGDEPLDNSPIFTSLSNNDSHFNSERLSTGGLRYAIKKRYTEAGITSDRLTFHSTRHYAATKLIKLGKPLLSVRDFLDHKSVTTTEIYVTTASRFDDPIAFELDLMKGN